MSDQTDLRPALSSKRPTRDLSPERDTAVVRPEVTRQVGDALASLAHAHAGGHTPIVAIARAGLARY